MNYNDLAARIAVLMEFAEVLHGLTLFCLTLCGGQNKSTPKVCCCDELFHEHIFFQQSCNTERVDLSNDDRSADSNTQNNIKKDMEEKPMAKPLADFNAEETSNKKLSDLESR